MRLHRFYVPIALELGAEYTHKASAGDFERTLINQLCNVFRYTAGSYLLLFDNSEREFRAQIVHIDRKSISYTIIDVSEPPANNSENVVIYLCMALIKVDKFELVVQKATELGVNSIFPICAERSIKRNLDIQRLEKISVEASEQSGRVTIPKIHTILSLKEVIQNNNISLSGKDKTVVSKTKTGDECSAPVNIALFCQMEGDSMYNVLHAALDTLGKNKFKSTTFWLFIGPEGGWSDEEIKICKESGFETISLNKNVLRAETAAISSISILSSFLN